MAEIDVIIDDLGNSVVHRLSGKVFATRILPWKELSQKQRDGLARWRFDWPSEAHSARKEVVALLVEGSGTVQGLISLEIGKGYVFVHLVENAPTTLARTSFFMGCEQPVRLCVCPIVCPRF
jgi:hypothetical protein